MMMRALASFVYANRRLEPGDTFTLINEHGDASVHRHVLLNAQLAEDIMANGGAQKKRRYKRRDMQAEDE